MKKSKFTEEENRKLKQLVADHSFDLPPSGVPLIRQKSWFSGSTSAGFPQRLRG